VDFFRAEVLLLLKAKASRKFMKSVLLWSDVMVLVDVFWICVTALVTFSLLSAVVDD
jgi:hypothetical protein